MEKIKFRIIPAMQAHIDQMKGKMRKEDEKECYATSHHTANEAMQMAFTLSRKAWTGTINNKPVFMFGVASAPRHCGCPWMIGTEDVKKIKMSILRVSKKYIREMLEPYKMLENFVDTRNKASKSWLKWCGFTIEEPEPYGVERMPFHRFWMKKEGGV